MRTRGPEAGDRDGEPDRFSYGICCLGSDLESSPHSDLGAPPVEPRKFPTRFRGDGPIELSTPFSKHESWQFIGSGKDSEMTDGIVKLMGILPPVPGKNA